MFRYLKKHGRNSSEQSPSGQSERTKRNSLSPSTTSCDETTNLDEIYEITNEDTVFEYSSRLSMNLNAIINEKNCLIYFVQFLEAKKALPLIKFYLDTENFKTASELAMEIESPAAATNCDDCPNNVDSVSLQSHEPTATGEMCKGGDDNSPDTSKESNKSVPGLKALYDMSMRESLTDDEKSQIYAKNNKRQLKRSESSISNSKQTCKTTDALCIYRKYFMPSSEQYVPLPVGILSEISLVLCADGQSCHTELISASLFKNAQQYVLEKLEHEYLYDFLQSNFYCNYCIELLSSSEMTLMDILYSESALFYFMEYLEQENQRNCLDFWMAASNFRKHYVTQSPSEIAHREAQADAMIIYEKYFSLQADCPLRFSDRIRCAIEESICTNEIVTPISRCFDRPLKIIEKYLENEFFPSFIKSELYAKYVNELQSKVSDHKRPDSAGTSTNQSQTIHKVFKHRKTMSDCTNKSTKESRKHFISQHNTLLAMETPPSHSHKCTSKNTSPDMQIDSRHFVNPDLLWQRNHTNGGLKFGRINSLGRYERDFEICPASRNWSLAMGGNTIKSVVKKLVNIPEDKIQEEIAWQIAEMIIDDVMSITMNSELSHKSV